MAARKLAGGGARKTSGKAKPRRASEPKRAVKGKAKPKAKAAPKRRAFGRTLLIWSGALAISAIIAIGAVIGYYAYDLPNVDTAERLDRPPSVTMTAQSGQFIARFGNLYGEAVALDALPAHLVHAVLATEDRRFYDHFGVDMIGLARAAWANWRAGRVVQGGSTLTQQLAKNLFLTAERTIARKIREVLLALYLESRFSKDQILTLYLNRVYLGAGTYGVAAAAEKYFGKPAARLTLPESAMLAGLLKAPSRYAPTNDLQAARARANQVLINMAAAGYLTDAAVEAAKRQPAGLARAPAATLSAAYFSDWVLEEVTAFVGRSGRDITVTTTLDPDLQRTAERVLVGALAQHGDRLDIGQGALVALAPDGAVRALVGGRDHTASQFNRATQARRQPGSAFKPFVYLAGLEAGLEPDDTMVDSPVVVDGWRPRNYSGRHAGEISLQQALARSINTVAVKVAERAGREQVIEVAYRLGITSELHDHPSIALGTAEVSLLELSAAYAPFANGGQAVLPYAIVQIRGADGEVLYQRAGSGLGRVVEPALADKMTAMLAAVLDGGTGRAAKLGRPAAGKTGTSQDFRDAWFVGYTPSLIAGVWFGNDDATPMRRVTGGGLPAVVWRDFMREALGGTPAQPLATSRPAPSSAAEQVWRRLFGQPDEPRAGAAKPRKRGDDSDGGP